MKRIASLILFIAVSQYLEAQDPIVGFSYQAVALDKSKSEQFGRDSQGEVLVNTDLQVRFTITRQAADGEEVFQEIHQTQTDIFGMFRLIVGRGDVSGGSDVGSLLWGEEVHFLHVEVDKGSGFEYLGNEELLGAPYAMNANSQKLQLSGNELSLSGGNAVILEDVSATNELISEVLLNGTTLEITESNTVHQVSLDGLSNLDTDNQNLSLVGNSLNIEDGTGVDLTSFMDNTDAQDLTLAGNTLSLTNDATTVDLSGYLDDTDTDDQTLSFDGSNLSIADGNSVDISGLSDGTGTDNQNLSLVGNNLNIEDGTGVDLSPFMDNTDAQDLSLTGNTLSLSNDATTVDLSGYVDWRLTGNAGITAANFIGTTDSQPIRFRINNIEKIRFSTNGTIEVLNTGESVFIGESAGVNDDQTNNRNVAIGFEAMQSNSSGFDNTSNGFRTLYLNTSGRRNTAVGYSSMFSNTTGELNTATGYASLYDNTIGQYNVADGYATLRNSTTGNGNTATGYQAEYANTVGSSNTATGFLALYYNETGNNNVAIGARSGPTATSLSNTIALGYQAIPSASNSAIIGNTSITSIGGYAPWSNLSDGRFKKEVQEDVPGLEFILKLRPVTYSWDMKKLHQFQNLSDSTLNENGRKVMLEKGVNRYTGFIAQEVETAATSIGYSFDAIIKPQNARSHYNLSYAEFVVPLTKAVQEQQTLIREQEKRLIKNESKIQSLEARLERLEALLQKDK